MSPIIPPHKVPLAMVAENNHFPGVCIPMHEFIQSSELKSQTRRLLGYRTLLMAVILVNVVLLLRVPMMPVGAARSGATGNGIVNMFRNRVATLFAGSGSQADTQPNRRSRPSAHSATRKPRGAAGGNW